MSEILADYRTTILDPLLVWDYCAPWKIIGLMWLGQVCARDTMSHQDPAMPRQYFIR